jgi:hypothetical protein
MSLDLGSTRLSRICASRTALPEASGEMRSMIGGHKVMDFPQYRRVFAAQTRKALDIPRATVQQILREAPVKTNDIDQASKFRKYRPAVIDEFAYDHSMDTAKPSLTGREALRRVRKQRIHLAHSSFHRTWRDAKGQSEITAHAMVRFEV